MPRRKRSAPETSSTTASTTTSKRHRTSSSSHSQANSATFNHKRCELWFEEYCSPKGSSDVLGPDGMEKFCEDIGVEPENVVMLCLAWKLGASQMGFFTKQEWIKGMSSLQCDNVQKLQARLPSLRALLNDPMVFKAIYRYAFDFARDKDQRSMDIATAKEMLTLLLGRHWNLFTSFHQFLENSRYKVINKDQWCNVLEFSRLIKPDLTNYDEDGAWPVMLDEFVEWHREQHIQPTPQPLDIS